MDSLMKGERREVVEGQREWQDIVLDTSAFIQGEIEPLRLRGQRLWTIPQVLEEVKDQRAKRSMQFAMEIIPDYVKVVVPKKESYEFVVDFAKKTGDFPALSRTDLMVLALTHELRQKQEGDAISSSQFMDTVRQVTEGDDQETDEETEGESTGQELEDANKPTEGSRSPAAKPVSTSSVVVPGKSWASVLAKSSSDVPAAKAPIKETMTSEQSANEPKIRQTTVMWSDEDFQVDGALLKQEKAQQPVEEWPSLPSDPSVKKISSAWAKPPSALLKAAPVDPPKEEPTVAEPAPIPVAEQPKPVRNPQASRILSSSTPAYQQTEDDDNDLEWATPGTMSTGWTPVARKPTGKKGFLSAKTPATEQGEQEAHLKAKAQPQAPACSVGCSTADFAVQNVLLQLKLAVISLDGRRITQVKNWVLKCDACYRIFPATQTRLFCPHCGHATLARLAYSIDAEGNRRYHYSKNRRVKTRGVVYSVPKGADLLLREDQLLSGIWAQRAQRKKNAASMFGEDVNDAMGLDLKALAVNQIKVGYGSQNPNARKGRERRGAKKKGNSKN